MAITKVTSSVLSSGSATDGYVLTADGSGNSAWEEVAGGPTFKTFGTDSIMIGDTTTGTIDAANYNVGLGVDVFADLTSGDNNVAVGFSALPDLTSGSNNSGVGTYALFRNTTGGSNVALGANALFNNSTASNNTAIGVSALEANTTGATNTAVGDSAGYSNTTGSQNFWGGKSAGANATTGSNNTCVGYLAGSDITTGTQNTVVGAGSQTSSASVSNEIVMGYNALGNGAVTVTFGIGTGTETYIGIGNTSWIGSSDERLKENITASTAGLSFINDLRPVTFDWKSKGSIPAELKGYEEGSDEKYNLNDKTNHGFIAQEVKTVLDNHPEVKNGHNIWLEKDDGTQALAPSALVPMLVKAIQELSAQNAELTTRIEALEG